MPGGCPPAWARAQLKTWTKGQDDAVETGYDRLGGVVPWICASRFAAVAVFRLAESFELAATVPASFFVLGVTSTV